MGNIVAIVGRPNVGKSTFFNRLTETRQAIVDEVSGVTRDRHYGKVFWNGFDFSIIDTGGYVTNSDDVFEEEIRKQVLLAIEEADVVIFLVDVISGITDLDETVAGILRKIKKPILLVVNKVDNSERMYDASVFYGLGLGDYFPLSSINGSGTGDMLDKLTSMFDKATDEEEGEEIPKIAVVGRPNVGKSSLVNALIGEERNIVTPISGTTRDSIHTRYTKFNHDFYLVDTAGLRKKGKVKEDLEFYSVMRSVRAIEHADVCLLLLDATIGIEGQDVNIFHLIERNWKGVVVLVNKWDLISKDNTTHKSYLERIRYDLKFLEFAPVIFLSALTGQRVFNIFKLVPRIYDNYLKRIQTHPLNKIISQATQYHPPPMVKNRNLKFYYSTQIGVAPPHFIIFTNYPKDVHFSYQRFLVNQFREHFEFEGTPIRISFKERKRKT